MLTEARPGIDHSPEQIEAFDATERGDGRAPKRELPASIAGAASRQLKSFVERIERLEEEKRTIADDIRDVYAEAKANGYDTGILRRVIVIRRQDKAEREEMEALLELYLDALGMTRDHGGA